MRARGLNKTERLVSGLWGFSLVVLEAGLLVCLWGCQVDSDRRGPRGEGPGRGAPMAA